MSVEVPPPSNPFATAPHFNRIPPSPGYQMSEVSGVQPRPLGEAPAYYPSINHPGFEYDSCRIVIPKHLDTQGFIQQANWVATAVWPHAAPLRLNISELSQAAFNNDYALSKYRDMVVQSITDLESMASVAMTVRYSLKQLCFDIDGRRQQLADEARRLVEQANVSANPHPLSPDQINTQMTQLQQMVA